MKTKNTKLRFKKNDITELNNEILNSVVGGTTIGGDCFLCIRTSNGPGGTVLEQLNQA